MDEHVQVEVVSRDRSTDYTAAIAATGRNITEVADRFHLNINMSDCVTKVIGSHYDEYRSAVRPEEVQETPKVDSRQVMFKEVKELQAEGLNIAQISKKLDIARQTVRKYIGCDTLPKGPARSDCLIIFTTHMWKKSIGMVRISVKSSWKSREKAFRVP